MSKRTEKLAERINDLIDSMKFEDACYTEIPKGSDSSIYSATDYWRKVQSKARTIENISLKYRLSFFLDSYKDDALGLRKIITGEDDRVGEHRITLSDYPYISREVRSFIRTIYGRGTQEYVGSAPDGAVVYMVDDCILREILEDYLGKKVQE